jgi:membrane protease YdiL (CAAX protease family)
MVFNLIYEIFGEKVITREYISVIGNNVAFIGIIILTYLLMAKHGEKISLINKINRVVVKQYSMGVFISIMMFVILVLILLVTRTIQFGNVVFLRPMGMIFVVASFMLQAYAEECLFRKYLQQKIEKERGIIVAIFYTNIMFACLHLLNSGITMLAIVNIFMLGTAFSILTYKTGTIIMVSGIHMGWNFCNEMVLGLPNSGLTCKDAMFSCKVIQENIWFHSIHGAEGGIGVSIIAIYMIVLFMKLKKFT